MVFRVSVVVRQSADASNFFVQKWKKWNDEEAKTTSLADLILEMDDDFTSVKSRKGSDMQDFLCDPVLEYAVVTKLEDQCEVQPILPLLSVST